MLLLLLLPITVTPIGDGGGRKVTLHNRTVLPSAATLGPVGGPGLSVEVGGHQKAAWFAQCEGVAPPLEARLERQRGSASVPSTRFPEGPPSLWISSARSGRAALEAVLKASGAGALNHVGTVGAPTHFGALRYAPFILVQARDLEAREPTARGALRAAVASGATLVVGTGEAGEASLEGFSPVRLGAVGQPGPALGAALARVSGRRALDAGEAAPRLTADGAPVVLESPLGLGLVRVLSVKIGELEFGPVADQAFAEAGDRLGGALAFLDRGPPLGEARRSPLGPLAWLALALLPLIGLLSRVSPRAALGAGAAWLGFGVFGAVQARAPEAQALRALYVPVGQQELLIAQLDLGFASGGGALVESAHALSLDGATPGACLVASPTRSALVTQAEPGDRARLRLFGWSARAEGGEGASITLPEWPAGPLAGVEAKALSRPSLPVEAPAQAYRVEPTYTAPEAIDLPAPPTPPQ